VSAGPLLTFEREDDDADVLVVTNGWPHAENDAYCIFIQRQVKSLIEHGLRCDVLFIRGYRSPLAYPLAAIRLFRWSIRSRRYRLVHAHSGEAALAGGFYRGAPMIVSYLGDDLLGRPRVDGTVPLVWKIRRAIVRQHARIAARTITKSQEMEDILPDAVRVVNRVIPNGVNTQLFRPIDRAAARKELRWEPQQRVVLFAADPDVVRKRFFLAEMAVNKTRQLLPDVRMEVAARVNPERMPLLMNAADCLILTSSIEGSPNVVKEALMCNLPVVSTPAGDVRELLRRVSPSCVCEPDADTLADALVKCLRVPSRSNGRAVSRRLDENAVAEEIVALYTQVEPTLALRAPTEGGSSGRTDVAAI
jgi:glycosyltransferase involved in cell wall biosynthesis